MLGGGGDGPQNPTKKFIIPKLKTDQMKKVEKSVQELKISSDEDENSFSSLKSLIECHKKTEAEKQLNDKTLAEFSQSFFDNVHLRSTNDKKFIIPKLMPKKDDNSENWVIDLTSALKTKSEPSHSKIFQEVFLADEVMESQTKERIYPGREPYLEFEDLKIESNLFSEKCSPFGKILCRKWRFSRPRILHKEGVLPPRIMRFDFNTPSPDDLILKHLRRK